MQCGNIESIKKRRELVVLVGNVELLKAGKGDGDKGTVWLCKGHEEEKVLEKACRAQNVRQILDCNKQSLEGESRKIGGTDMEWVADGGLGAIHVDRELLEVVKSVLRLVPRIGKLRAVAGEVELGYAASVWSEKIEKGPVCFGLDSNRKWVVARVECVVVQKAPISEPASGAGKEKCLPDARAAEHDLMPGPAGAHKGEDECVQFGGMFEDMHEELQREVVDGGRQHDVYSCCFYI
uniref:Uncharacterized protein n=1 Tax=Mycena chlorophos TaxID=658473 RepID=A0ABQ0LH82_MYCCL|nr:predicted protein [Mycena chlorophos]